MIYGWSTGGFMFKLSKYNLYVENSDDLFIFNSYVGLRSISKIAKSGNDGLIHSLRYDFDEQQFSSDELTILRNKGLIVEESENELEKVKYFYNNLVNGSVLNITILPTRNCNFRCKYCYESFENKKMSKDICDRLIKYVSKNISHYSGLHVSWFGGEPLVAKDVIDYLSEAFMAICKVGKKRYTANITTNGYLLDYDYFQKLLSYHVTKFQVTIDGLRQEHDQNRVQCNGHGTFDTILQNIIRIKQECNSGRFNFVIRTNFNKNSISRIPEYIKFLEETIGTDSRFSLFVRTVSYLGGGDEVIANNEDNFTGYKERNQIFNAVSNTLSTLSLDVNYDMLHRGQCVCYAALHNHIVFDVDGVIRKCTCNLDDNENNNLGYIDAKGELNLNYALYNRWIGSFTEKKQCINCSFLPICLQKNCPANSVYNQIEGCPYEKLELDSLIQAFIKTNYIKTIFEE